MTASKRANEEMLTRSGSPLPFTSGDIAVRAPEIHSFAGPMKLNEFKNLRESVSYRLTSGRVIFGSCSRYYVDAIFYKQHFSMIDTVRELQDENSSRMSI